jgi:hypothetical protein
MVRTAKQTTVSNEATVWFAYDDGVMLRQKNGVGRKFKTQEAAMKAKSAR